LGLLFTKSSENENDKPNPWGAAGKKRQLNPAIALSGGV
jgi:hypothetical protein